MYQDSVEYNRKLTVLVYFESPSGNWFLFSESFGNCHTVLLKYQNE